MAESDSPSEVLERVELRYRIRFAGFPRVSRDPELLDEMLAALEQIPQESLHGELAERVAKARELYANERKAIVESRAVPGALQAHRLGLWVDLVASRYQRSFAGHDRSTRDVQILDEVRTHLQRLRKELEELGQAAPHVPLEAPLKSANRMIALTRSEAARVREARGHGDHPTQGTRLARLANDQFELYQRDFAGKSRLSRHRPRLERIVKALQEIGAGMARLQREGFVSETNDKNLEAVTNRRAAYVEELNAIRDAVQQVALEERIGALGAAANALFAEYREAYAGKNRLEVNADRLNEIMEALLAIALEMDAIDQAEADDTNEKNLAVVLDHLVMFQREWTSIREAKMDA